MLRLVKARLQEVHRHGRLADLGHHKAPLPDVDQLAGIRKAGRNHAAPFRRFEE
jgi:hypothetical protein